MKEWLPDVVGKGDIHHRAARHMRGAAALLHLVADDRRRDAGNAADIDDLLDMGDIVVDGGDRAIDLAADLAVEHRADEAAGAAATAGKTLGCAMRISVSSSDFPAIITWELLSTTQR